MRDIRSILRTAAVGMVCLVLAACNAQDAPVAPHVDWPEPTTPQVTHVHGRVIDVVSGAPVPFASVAAEEVEVTATENGEYSIGNLRQDAVTLIATKAGYVTTSSYIPLEGGDKEFVLRMQPLAADAAH